MKKPHVILINPDQMRFDAMGHMGNPAAVTPCLDALARQEGVSFQNAFCQNPICTPSRCSFFSGLYPHVFGHRTISFMQYLHEPSLLRTMKENGYDVWMNDRNDFLPAQMPGIFSEYCDELYVPQDLSSLPPPVNPNPRGEKGSDSYYSFFVGEVGTDENHRYFDADASSVQALVSKIKTHSSEKPLCAFLGLLAPHPDYLVEEPYFSTIDRKKLPPRVRLKDPLQKSAMLRGLRELYGMQNWTEERFDALRATYLGMCSKVDYFLGQIIAALRDAGLYDDTLLVFFSDHGDYTGDYELVEKAQNTFEDCLVRVPLLIKPPKAETVRPGIRTALTELVDMYATVLDYTGVPAPETHFGRSLREVISGKSDEHRACVFSEGGRLPGETHCNSAAVGADESAPYYPRFTMQSTDACLKATMLRTQRYKYIKRMGESDELYDLENDPKELCNLAQEPACRELIHTFRETMLDWYQETCDIVPQKPDQRFNQDMLLSKLSVKLPPEKLEAVKSRVAQGEGLQQALQSCKGK